MSDLESHLVQVRDEDDRVAVGAHAQNEIPGAVSHDSVERAGRYDLAYGVSHRRLVPGYAVHVRQTAEEIRIPR